jgi:hypothetical protein
MGREEIYSNFWYAAMWMTEGNERITLRGLSRTLCG